MKFVFATTTQAPWPGFIQKSKVAGMLMSYWQLRNIPDLIAFMKEARK